MNRRGVYPALMILVRKAYELFAILTPNDPSLR